MHQAAKLVREEELLRLLMAGYMLKECASQMQMSYRTVREYAKQADFLQRLKALSEVVYARVDGELRASKEAIVQRLEEASDKALDEMMKLVEMEGTGMVKLKACQDIMDRDQRVSRTKKVEGSVSHDFVNPMLLVHAAATARELEQYEAKKKGLPEPNGDAGHTSTS
jgi:hypothetical protein